MSRKSSRPVSLPFLPSPVLGWGKAGLVLALLVAAALLAGCRGRIAPSWPGLAMSGQRLYVSGGNRVVALNPESGQPLWMYPPDGKGKVIFTTPPGWVSDANLVLVGDQTGNLYALDADTGQPRWQHQDDGYPFIARPVHVGDAIFAPSSSGTLYVFDAKGQVRWTFHTKAPLWAEAVVHENTVYLASMDRHLYALDVDTGRVRWKQNLAAPMAHGPLFKEGRLYVPTYGKGVKAVDPEQGKVLWTALEGAWVWHTPQDGGKAIFVGTMDGRVVALHPESGQVLWEKNLDAAVVARPGWDEARGVVYIAGENGTLWALDGDTGNVRWSRAEDGWKKKLYTEPLPYEDRVFLALHTTPPTLLALDAGTGQTEWVYPSETK